MEVREPKQKEETKTGKKDLLLFIFHVSKHVLLSGRSYAVYSCWLVNLPPSKECIVKFTLNEFCTC